ncbi:unnamed protein product [Calypogeia fissa]
MTRKQISAAIQMLERKTHLMPIWREQLLTSLKTQTVSAYPTLEMYSVCWLVKVFLVHHPEFQMGIIRPDQQLVLDSDSEEDCGERSEEELPEEEIEQSWEEGFNDGSEDTGVAIQVLRRLRRALDLTAPPEAKLNEDKEEQLKGHQGVLLVPRGEEEPEPHDFSALRTLDDREAFLCRPEPRCEDYFRWKMDLKCIWALGMIMILDLRANEKNETRYHELTRDYDRMKKDC